MCVCVCVCVCARGVFNTPSPVLPELLAALALARDSAHSIFIGFQVQLLADHAQESGFPHVTASTNEQKIGACSH
jgi:hypothetical protein